MFEIKPKTRKEIYMAYLAGDMSLELPEPLTRDEVTLYNLCQSHAYGSATTVKEVLAECQPPYMGDSGFVLEGVAAPTITGGESYIVNWNGTEYTCVAVDGTAVGQPGGAVMGDVYTISGGQFGNPTGEPFVIMSIPGTGMMLRPLDGSTTLTISIRQEVTEVKKISGKYVEGMGWSEIGEKVLADNVIIPPNANEDEMEIPGVVLSVGEVYTVIYDGVRYENLTCFKNEQYGWLYIGSAPNDFSEYGFCILTNGGKTLCSRYSTGGQNTVTVIGRGETIHPIDPKFLPSVNLYVEYPKAGYIYKDMNCTEKVSAEELYKINTAIVVNCNGLRLFPLAIGFESGEGFIIVFGSGGPINYYTAEHSTEA